MGVIVDLYHGDLRLDDLLAAAPGKYQKARSSLYRKCEVLNKELPTDLCEKFIELMDLQGEALMAAEESGFEYGFSLAAQVLAEVSRIKNKSKRSKIRRT